MKPRLLTSGLTALLVLAGPVSAQETGGSIIPIIVGPSDEATKISVTINRGLRSSRTLRSSALRRARTAMQSGEFVSKEDLRKLGLAGDGLAAQRYVRAILAEDTVADPSEVAYFSAIAIGTGRIWTLKPMIAAMHQLDPAKEPRDRIRKYIQVLYPHAWAGNSVALEALVAFNGEGRLFGPLSDRTRDRILEQAKQQGDGRTELTLAMGILEKQRSVETADRVEVARAREFLVMAAESDHLSVRTTAQNLLRLIEGD